MIYDKVKARGTVRRVVTDQNGNIKDDLQVNNLVVSSGQAFICSRMAGVSNGVMTHMGLGSGTTAANAADTDIESILGSREALDSTTVSANVQLQKQEYLTLRQRALCFVVPCFPFITNRLTIQCHSLGLLR